MEIIFSPQVPLPWDFQRFYEQILRTPLIQKALLRETIVLWTEYEDSLDVRSSSSNSRVNKLVSDHKEEDTWIVLNDMNSSEDQINVVSEDTEFLLLFSQSESTLEPIRCICTGRKVRETVYWNWKSGWHALCEWFKSLWILSNKFLVWQLFKENKTWLKVQIYEIHVK